MTTPHAVVVVDDQAPFRLAAKAVLRRIDCFELAGEASSGPKRSSWWTRCARPWS